MIRGFRDRGTADIFAGQSSKAARRTCPIWLWEAAHFKLTALHQASRLDEFMRTPGTRLEALAGNRLGQFSIRINAQYRICFTWRGGDAHEVEIVDYHR